MATATATEMLGIRVWLLQNKVFEEDLEEFLEDVQDYILREERDYMMSRQYETAYLRRVYLYIPKKVWKKIKAKYKDVSWYNVVEQEYDNFLIDYEILDEEEIKKIKKSGKKITVIARIMDYEIDKNVIREFEQEVKEKGYLVKKERVLPSLLARDYVLEYILRLPLQDWEELLYKYEDYIFNPEEICY